MDLFESYDSREDNKRRNEWIKTILTIITSIRVHNDNYSYICSQRRFEYLRVCIIVLTPVFCASMTILNLGPNPISRALMRTLWLEAETTPVLVPFPKPEAPVILTKALAVFNL